MKRLFVFAVMAALIPSAALAGAVGVFGSYWDSEDAGESYGYGVRLASTSDQAGYLEVRASRFNKFEDKDSGEKNEFDIIPLDLGITLSLSGADTIQFYIGGGGTYYLMETEIDTPTGKRDIDLDNEWGWYGLVGLAIELTDNLLIFGEGTYRKAEGTIPGDKLDNVNSDVTVKLDGFGGNVGILLLF